jgi:hypothetical protein
VALKQALLGMLEANVIIQDNNGGDGGGDDDEDNNDDDDAHLALASYWCILKWQINS